MTKKLVAFAASVVLAVGTMLAALAPVAQAYHTGWNSYSSSPSDGGAKFSGTYMWYGQAYPNIWEGYGGFRSYGTLQDGKYDDINTAKYRVRIDGYAWATYTVKNGRRDIPDLIRYDPASINVRNAYVQTCTMKLFFDTCSTIATYRNPWAK